MQAQIDFRAVVQACQEDFSMPTYTLSKLPEQPKLSVGGLFGSSQMYSESPFEKAATNRDSKELLSNSKEGTMPLSFWTFSYATSGVELGSQVTLQRAEN